MKKTMMKKVLLSLSVAFVASAAVGINALTADASDALNPAFASLALQGGASVRYVAGEDATEQGFSYVLEMDKDAYEAVAASEEITNVKYGILIGPEAYYQAHPFNTQANIDTYYSLNTEEAGKAFLYDMKAVEFTGAEESSKVFYRGSIVDVQGENMVRDYRGVGYVAYTYDNTDYKFFFTDDNVRCPVEIADLTIDTLDPAVEEDAAKIEDLQARYINQIDWTVDLHDAGTRGGQWTQTWGLFDAAGPVYHTKSWETKYNNNRYINSKYTTTYTWERAGEESVPYAAHSVGTDAQRTAIKNFEGIWTLNGRTTCEFLPEEVQSYTYKVTFVKLGSADSAPVTVNGSTIAQGDPGSWWWDDSRGQYYTSQSYAIKGDYNKTATGNFIVDFELEEGNGSCEFLIHTTNDNYLAFTAKDGGNTAGNDGMYIYADKNNDQNSTWWTETRIKHTDGSVFTNPNIRGVGAVKMRVVNFSNTFYLFSNTYWDSTNGAVATADHYTLIAKLNGSTFTGFNGMTISSNGGGTHIKKSVSNLFAAATNNEFAFAVKGNAKPFYAYLTLEDDDTNVYNFMKSANVPGITFINNTTVEDNYGDYWTKDATTGVWSQSTADQTAYKVVETASGDWMATMKINSASSQANARFFYAPASFVEVMSPNSSQLFFTGNGKWASETLIGAATTVFHNEDFDSAEGADGYLDVMVVKSGNTFGVYVCEYLDAEGKAATYDSWKLMFSVTADGTTTYGEGFAQASSNGWGNVVNSIKGLLGANEVGIALACRSGTGAYKVNVVDDDATVAAFMAGDKAVATYAKA